MSSTRTNPPKAATKSTPRSSQGGQKRRRVATYDDDQSTTSRGVDSTSRSTISQTKRRTDRIIAAADRSARLEARNAAKGGSKTNTVTPPTSARMEAAESTSR